MKRWEFKIHTGHVSSNWVLGGNVASFAVRDKQPAYNAISFSINLLFWTLMLTRRTFLSKEQVRNERNGVKMHKNGTFTTGPYKGQDR